MYRAYTLLRYVLLGNLQQSILPEVIRSGKPVLKLHMKRNDTCNGVCYVYAFIPYCIIQPLKAILHFIQHYTDFLRLWFSITTRSF